MKYANLELGTIEAVFNKLGGLEGAQRFLSGVSEVVVRKHVVDCDADPFIPDGWEVKEHKKGGTLEWDAAKVTLYLADGQKNGNGLEGNDLRKQLAKQSVLNANVLDYLLKNPHLIPEEWKGKYVFFWGTVYRDSLGLLHVRCLYWVGDKWDWDYGWLAYRWVGGDPAAVSAS